MADLNPKEGPRYANTDEFKSEFGDYRVNGRTDNLCDMESPTKVDEVKNDPFAEAQSKESY